VTTDPLRVAKSRSEGILTARGLPINAALPFIESPDELKPPSATEVAARCFVLSHLIGLHYGQPSKRLAGALAKHGLMTFLTPLEQDLLGQAKPPRQSVIDAGWLPEAVQVLAWGLGLVELDHWRHCDDDLANHFPPYTDPQPFLASTALRPFSIIYDECDFLYRLHWAVRHLKDRGKSAGLNWQLVLERHRAINWLAGVEPNWDEVTTDT
jgi:hypothetical protein